MLGNRFHWYLMVEVAIEDRVIKKMYGRVVYNFMQKIVEVRSQSLFLLMCLTHSSRKEGQSAATSCGVKASWSTL